MEKANATNVSGRGTMPVFKVVLRRTQSALSLIEADTEEEAAHICLNDFAINDHAWEDDPSGLPRVMSVELTDLN
jgi:hypothetical protein